MSSKRAQILERLRATILPLISTDDGYNFTPKTIERGWRHPVDLAGNFPAIFIATTNERREFNALGTPRTYGATLTVIIVGYVENSKSNPQADGTGVQKDLDNLIEDITHALFDDITQGGLVTATDITTVETDNGDLTPIGGCAVTAQFTYYEEGNATP